jgi:hypothetical protein
MIEQKGSQNDPQQQQGERVPVTNRAMLKAYYELLNVCSGHERDLSFVDELTEERAGQVLEAHIRLAHLFAGNAKSDGSVIIP